MNNCKYYLAIIILSFFSLIAYAQPDQFQIENQLLDSAQLLHNAAKYDSVIIFCERAIEFHQQSTLEKDTLIANAYLILGKSLFKMGKYDEALTYHQQTYDIRKANFENNSPSLAEAIYQIGADYYGKAKYDDAVKYFEEALEMRKELFGEEHPLVIKGYFSIGSIAYQRGDYNAAEKSFKEVLRLREKVLPPNHFDIMSSYLSIGAIQIEKDEFDQAIESMNKALEISLKKYPSDHPDVGVVYGNIGLAYYSKGSNDKALEYFIKSLNISQKALGEEHPDIAFYHHRIGNLYNSQNEFQKALHHFKISEKIWIRAFGPDNINSAWAYFGMGTTLLHIAEHKEALSYLNKALNVLLTEYSEPNSIISNVYTNLALVYQNLEQHDLAIENFNEALRISRKIYGEEHSSIALILNNLGSSYRNLGEYEKAFTAFQKALYLRKKIYKPDHFELTGSYGNLGILYNDVDESQIALGFYKKSLQINIKNFGPDNANNSNLFFSIGNIYLKSNQLDSALVYFHAALNIDTLSWGAMHPKTAGAYRGLGRTYEQLDQNDKALMMFQKGLKISEATNGAFHPAIALSDLYLGKHLTKTKKYYQAHIFLQKALKIRKHSQQVNHPELANYYFPIGKLYANKNEMEIAKLYFDSTLICINNIKRFYNTPLSRKSHLREAKSCFEQIIDFEISFSATKNEQSQKAFHVFENTKNNNLLDAVYNSKAKRILDLPEDYLKIENELESDLTYFDKKRNEFLDKGLGISDTTVLAITTKRNVANKKYQDFIQSLEINFPDYYKLKYNIATTNVQEIQNTILTEDQSLVAFYVGDEYIFLYLIQKNNYEVHQIKNNFPLNQWIEKFSQKGIYGFHTLPRHLQSRRKEAQAIKNYTKAAHQLYEKLFSPIEKKLTKEIIIIPDGVLGYIPFEALLTKPAQKIAAFDTYDFMVKQYQISYTYSATLLREMLQKQHEKSPQKSLLGFAPFFQDDVQQLVSMIDSSELFTLRDSLNHLPASGKEVASVQKLMNGKAFYGIEASINQFQKNASEYQILHLSTHGKADSLTGDFAYLAFASANDKNNYEKLYARDLYNYRLNADMVVLSACETGIGKLEKGEGIISLARSFAYAGAKSVFTTLWQVNDNKTMELMIVFYKKMKLGYPKNVALQKAKLNFLKNNTSTYQHPFYWAGMIGIGDMNRLGNN